MSEQSLATTPFQLSDANQLFELFKDSNIIKEFPFMKIENKSDVKQFLENQIEISKNSSTGFFKAIRIVFNGLESVYTEKNNIVIGFISLGKIDVFEQMLSGGFEQTLSFAVKSAYTGKGIMTMALNMNLDAMFQDRYNVIASIVKRNNKASIRVLEKCGFTMVRDSHLSLLYVKRITMNENEFKRVFEL